MAGEIPEMNYAPEGKKDILGQPINPEAQKAAADKLIKQMKDANDFREMGTHTPEQEAQELVELKNKLDRESGGVTEVTLNTPKPSEASTQTTPETVTTTSTETVNNDTLTVLGSGNLTSTETKAATEAQRSIESGTTSPDNIQKVSAAIKDIFASLPDGLKKFFGSFLAMFEKLSGTENADKKANLEKIKDEENRKVLEKYGVTVDNSDNKNTKLVFQSGSTIEGTNTPKPIEPIDTAKQPEKKTLSMDKNGPLILDPSKTDIKTTNIKDTQDGFTMTVKNKDGSTDTYTIKSTKKPASTSEGVKA